jgi:hypothetical protein
MQIDSSDEQPANADSPRLDRVQPVSNVRDESWEQQQKQDFEIVSIDEGIQIDSSDLQSSKADSPSFEIFESSSNVKLER